jgi:hypothetical protein
MTHAVIFPELPGDRQPPMPRWAASARDEDPETVAFSSGAALAVLHLALARPGLPVALLRERRALSAAAACVAFAGRPEREAELRDATCLLRPGEQPGPAGEVWLRWQAAVAHKLSARARPDGIGGAVPAAMVAQLPDWLAGGAGEAGAPVGGSVGGPVGAAAVVLERGLAAHPGEVGAALILAEVVLARRLGWPHPVPVLAPGLRWRDLGLTGAALRLACHRAVVTGAADALRGAAELERRAARLAAVAPKLRTRRADAAVALLLARDALAPAALTGLMSDRAARRFCDRLVELGAARELTGRDTFRLYGL